MNTGDFDYHLPKGLIAQSPLEPRDSSRLLVLHRQPRSWEHRHFPDLLEFLDPGDALVVNTSRVFPARIYARQGGSEGRIELLLLHRVDGDVWKAIGQPGRKLRPGRHLEVVSEGDEGSIEVLDVDRDGIRTVRLSPGLSLDRAGELALPPYIHTSLTDGERYQTIYSRDTGSVAAPTAGLHFTQGLLDSIGAKGVNLVQLTLHVGPDTFLPVRKDDPLEHKLQGEFFSIDEGSASRINEARNRGGKVVAVGTTTVRALEQAALISQQMGSSDLLPSAGLANLYILPGHRFRVIDAMVTNFHLPRSTLIMLVSAFARRELVMECYREAVREKYRFYSFGDAMLIL
ncbi:MAG: tRNA preQ1(34) S-adenosylmethionine ribosyltransferase-isomerase QueA [Dehalococcoidia bacterium]|nr:tRNA preQ1(34) S-adenosylmethionine ribosyltransferase-isomerase QueA [Dehalococcoidia bacterium]